MGRVPGNSSYQLATACRGDLSGIARACARSFALTLAGVVALRGYSVTASLRAGRPREDSVQLIVVGRALDREIDVLDPRQLGR
jgi:hypothetical protein